MQLDFERHAGLSDLDIALEKPIVAGRWVDLQQTFSDHVLGGDLGDGECGGIGEEPFEVDDDTARVSNTGEGHHAPRGDAQKFLEKLAVSLKAGGMGAALGHLARRRVDTGVVEGHGEHVEPNVATVSSAQANFGASVASCGVVPERAERCSVGWMHEKAWVKANEFIGLVP
jgi:hypothetical protein